MTELSLNYPNDFKTSSIMSSVPLNPLSFDVFEDKLSDRKLQLMEHLKQNIPIMFKKCKYIPYSDDCSFFSSFGLDSLFTFRLDVIEGPMFHPFSHSELIIPVCYNQSAAILSLRYHYFSSNFQDVSETLPADCVFEKKTVRFR